MKSFNGTLDTYLASSPEQLFMADAFTFFLASGANLYFSSLDVPFVLGGNTFLANSVRVQGLKYTIKTGLEVDEQDVTIMALPTDTVGGVPFIQALRQGVFDGAYLQRDRVFFSSWALPLAVIGSTTVFHGRISTIDKVGRTVAQMKVKSDLLWLDIDMPRNIWQPSCLHTLYDSGCTLSKSAFAVTGTVGASPGFSTIPWSGALAKFAQGQITFTSGVNDGVSASIKSADGSNLYLVYPLYEEPAPGDTFTAYPGCDKTLATCTSRFSNAANFRGFPFVPAPDTAI